MCHIQDKAAADRAGAGEAFGMDVERGSNEPPGASAVRPLRIA